MPVPLSKPHHLVFDRRTITRAHTGNSTAIDSGAMQIGADNRVGCRCGGGNPAFGLRVHDRRRHRAERFRHRIPMIGRQTGPVDRCPLQPRRRPRLQPAKRQVQPRQGLRQANRWRFANPPCRRLGIPNMDHPTQKRARGQHRRTASDPGSIRTDHRGQPAIRADLQILHRTGSDFETLGLRQQRLNGPPIQAAIRLGPRTTDRRPLAAIQELEMNAGHIRRPAHDAIQRIDLPHQMALANAANGGIAGHFANRLQTMGQQQGARAQPRCRCHRLATGMAAADHHHIKLSGHSSSKSDPSSQK